MADLIITAGNVLIYDGAEIGHGRAGEAVTAGEAVYQHTDGKLWLADCATAAKANAKGVALNDAATNQPVAYIKKGGLNPGAAVTVGAVYGVTDTGGGIGLISERAAEDYMTILGVASTTSRIDVQLNVSGAKIPT